MGFEENDLIDWPPQFVLKRHPRARHVKLKASKYHGLEIVVPLRFNYKHIPEILESNKEWIKKRLLEIQESIDEVSDQPLPKCINLLACNQIWDVTYIKSDNKKLQLMVRQSREVVIYGSNLEKKDCLKLLINWVKAKAKDFLLERLDNLSQNIRLDFSKGIIRAQRGRWGSCNSNKTISLNYKLIFLPEALVNHVIIHELCHTVHLNHSAKYWRLVSSFDPNWKQHNRDLRSGDDWIPRWI